MPEHIVCESCKSKIDANSVFCINCGDRIKLVNTQRKVIKRFLPTVIENTKKSIENHFSTIFVLFIAFLVVLSFSSLIYYELILRRLRLEFIYELAMWLIFFKILLAIFQVPLVYRELENSDSFVQKIKVIFVDFIISIPTFNSPILTPVIYLVSVFIVHEQLIAIFTLSPIVTQFEFVFYFIFIFVSILISIRLSVIIPTMVDTKKGVIDSFQHSINETGKDKLGLFSYMIIGNFIMGFVGYFALIAGGYFALLFTVSTIGSPYGPGPYSFNLPLIVIFGSFFFIAQLVDYFGRVNIYKLLKEKK